jgi:hypothetical protein
MEAGSLRLQFEWKRNIVTESLLITVRSDRFSGVHAPEYARAHTPREFRQSCGNQRNDSTRQSSPRSAASRNGRGHRKRRSADSAVHNSENETAVTTGGAVERTGSRRSSRNHRRISRPRKSRTRKQIGTGERMGMERLRKLPIRRTPKQGTRNSVQEASEFG